MKVKPHRTDAHPARQRRRFVAGGLLALLTAPLWQPATALAQSPGIGALMQGHGRLAGRADANARRERERQSARPEGRPRPARQRAEREAAERPGRNGAKLSPDERRRLRQNLYDLGREMYNGG